MKYLRLKNLLTILMAVLVLAAFYQVFSFHFVKEKNEVSFNIKDFFGKLTPVYSDIDRERGLGGKDTRLAENEGMLFVFEKPAYYKIWMKGMFFSIDILWLDEHFNIIDVKKNVDPSTYPESFGPASTALYVVEFKAGTIDKYKINIGDKMTL